jgi:hypothetical protein
MILTEDGAIIPHNTPYMDFAEQLFDWVRWNGLTTFWPDEISCVTKHEGTPIHKQPILDGVVTMLLSPSQPKCMKARCIDHLNTLFSLDYVDFTKVSAECSITDWRSRGAHESAEGSGGGVRIVYGESVQSLHLSLTIDVLPSAAMLLNYVSCAAIQS